MRPKLISFFSTDVDACLSKYYPSEPDNFGFLARLIVGEEKTEGGDIFDVMICTPQWLMSNFQESDIIIGRHYLIVFEYNYQRIYSRLKKLIENIHGDNWEEIALKIGRIGHWEFEDYQP